MNEKSHAITGCLLGTAVGDALGLAGEGLSRRRLARLFPDMSRMHFLGHWGMVSDDTEHTCLVAQALIESAGETDAFTRALARRLRFWLLGLPAGVGWATLRAILKLWVGAPPDRSGVWSAGNGPAMRSALLGVCYGDGPGHLKILVRASSRMTHTDPRAEAGALAVAVAAHLASQRLPGDALPDFYLQAMEKHLEKSELLRLIEKAAASVKADETTDSFAAAIGAGQRVTGYVNLTVPIVVHAWLSFPSDYASAVLSVIRCGGDTDTTAAIVGAIVGAAVGEGGIPMEWLAALAEWPRTVDWMKHLGNQLTESQEFGVMRKPLGLPFVPLMARNLLFTTVVLAHGFRRLLPPY
ncbi:MAG: ADP-ribosylglycohydrolase family protein [Janthinobacterium lividum]